MEIKKKVQIVIEKTIKRHLAMKENNRIKKRMKYRMQKEADKKSTWI